MQKSYEGVKTEKRCEVVTVGSRAARVGESRSNTQHAMPLKVAICTAAGYAKVGLNTQSLNTLRMTYIAALAPSKVFLR